MRGISIVLPATSANLGPAFDAAALALSLYLKVSATASDEFSIIASGRDPEICGAMQDHLILTTYSEVLQAERKPVHPLRLQIENEIPIGKGCGSSAAARLAGIALANHFGHLRWSRERIIGEASTREHHPDNAAACWLGGLAIARMASEREAQVVQLTPKGKWPLLLAVPDESLSTEEARRVLPREYSRADVVTNIQNSMLLLAAFSRGEHRLLDGALGDRVHQPYRSPLCPLLPALQTLVGGKGVAGVALSGAGPSVLIFVDPRMRLPALKKRVRQYLSEQNLTAELIETEISKSGARLSGSAADRRRVSTQRP
ncbi:MAG TPA: homoserine kinase [Terriglobales bacterium]|nr:homoserine kinase [Terriglobales bacterium]